MIIIDIMSNLWLAIKRFKTFAQNSQGILSFKDSWMTNSGAVTIIENFNWNDLREIMVLMIEYFNKATQLITSWET